MQWHDDAPSSAELQDAAEVDRTPPKRSDPRPATFPEAARFRVPCRMDHAKSPRAPACGGRPARRATSRAPHVPCGAHPWHRERGEEEHTPAHGSSPRKLVPHLVAGVQRRGSAVGPQASAARTRMSEQHPPTTTKHGAGGAPKGCGTTRRRSAEGRHPKRNATKSRATNSDGARHPVTATPPRLPPVRTGSGPIRTLPRIEAKRSAFGTGSAETCRCLARGCPSGNVEVIRIMSLMFVLPHVCQARIGLV